MHDGEIVTMTTLYPEAEARKAVSSIYGQDYEGLFFPTWSSCHVELNLENIVTKACSELPAH